MCDDRLSTLSAEFAALIARKESEARKPYADKIMALEAELDGWMDDHSAAVRELDKANAALAECKRQHAKDVEDAENCMAEMRDDVAGAVQASAEVHTLRAKIIELQAAIQHIGFRCDEERDNFWRFPQR